MEHDSDPAQVGLFMGEATPLSADVHAVWYGPSGAEPELTGYLYGPFCETARTLPAKCPFRRVLSVKSFVGTAFIPDPCFWTPAAPYYYRAKLEIKTGNKTVAIVEQEVGIRTLGVRERDLWLSGKRWVLRAVEPGTADLGPIDQWHAAGAALVTGDTDDTLLREASRQGVLLVVDLSDWAAERAVDQLLHLARWPAVGIVILPDEVEREMLEPSEAFSYLTTNLLLAQRFDADRAADPIEPAAWADVAVCQGAPAEIARRSAYCEIPVLAQLAGGKHADIAAARRACDLLQRDLAPYRDYAGYVV